MLKRILICLLVLLVIGCKGQSDFEFSVSDCDEDIDPFEEQTEEVKTQWSGGVFYATTQVSTNCAYSIEDGNYEVNDNDLILRYSVKKSAGGLIAKCMCAQELKWVIKDIEQKEYEISLNQ